MFGIAASPSQLFACEQIHHGVEVQSLARSPGQFCDSSVHRHGRWLQRVLAASSRAICLIQSSKVVPEDTGFFSPSLQGAATGQSLCRVGLHAVLRLSRLLGRGVRALAGGGGPVTLRGRGAQVEPSFDVILFAWPLLFSALLFEDMARAKDMTCGLALRGNFDG
jgi:hypothetical protein